MSSASDMSSYNHDAAAAPRPTPIRLFHRQRPLHDVLGGGEVADILLWRKPKLSAVLLLSISMIWFIFEIVEYSFVTLLCHIFITTMAVFFIWCTLSELFKWKTPDIPKIIVHETTFEQAAIAFHALFNQFLATLLDIACGKDIRLFFLATGFLLILSRVGNHISTLNLLFISYICMQVLPFLYEKYEDEVDRYAGEMYQEMKKWYKKFDETVLVKIPRGPSYDRKMR